MSDVIQRYPFGMPDLFGLKAGQTPQVIAPQIGCSVDVRDLYLINGRTTRLALAIAGAVGLGNTFPDLTVPVGEMWYVQKYQVFSAAVLTATVRIKPAVRYSPTGGAAIVVGATAGAGVAGDVAYAVSDEPFLMLPGAIFQLLVESQSAATNYQATVAYTPLRV